MIFAGPAMKEISVGRESFAKYIEKNSFYVDKTSLIKKVFKNDQSDVLLITRPRRFGKTLTLSTFHEFLRINPNNPDNPEDTSYQERLFKDTKIFEDKEFCQEYMGKFPVISVSFKTVFGRDFKSAYDELGGTIFDLVSKYGYLLENKNGRLSESQLAYLKKLSDYDFACDFKNKNYIIGSLAQLTELLCAYHGVKPILLIDEYDVPIAKAAAKGYYDDIIDIMSVLLSKALKTNPHLGKAVLTGCLRAAKESIFTGLNNLKVFSVLNDGNEELSKGIGFTKEETFEVLKYYSLDKYYGLVIDHYDGYYFGDVHMCCPWDVMNFCSDNYQKTNKANAKIKADNYWINTSGNDVIEEYMGYIQPEHVEQMQTLVNGKSIFTAVRPSLCYGDLKNHDIEDFWTLLLYTGYLTFNPDYESDRRNEYELRIPNEEILECFEEKVQSFFNGNRLMKNYTVDLVEGLFEGNAEAVETNLNFLLKKYVSVRDSATKAPKENYYHGFMNGLLVNGSTTIQEQHSNMESGSGYVDLIISSASESEVAILEIKHTDRFADNRSKIALSAIQQIEEKLYADPYMNNDSIKHIYAYGICFYKKQCSVAVKTIK